MPDPQLGLKRSATREQSHRRLIEYLDRWVRVIGKPRNEPRLTASSGAWRPECTLSGTTTRLCCSTQECIRAVAEYLDHHDPGFTLRTYAYLMPESEDRARAAVDLAHSRAESTRNAEKGEK